MSVLLWTDTLGDVNGVARFITTLAEWEYARETGHIDRERKLRVFASTRKVTPRIATITNFVPAYARSMPLYPQLDLAFPPAKVMIRAADALAPRVIHVSTPGPVGLLGRWYALSRGLPLVGVYHTDFPAYVGRFAGGDETLTGAAEAYMRWFYRPFTRVLLRSKGGVPPPVCERARYTVARLTPGVDVTLFSPRERAGVQGPPRALYVGRLSIEKNLCALARIWRGVEHEYPGAQLWVVGDGPLRGTLENMFQGCNVTFTGFLLGKQLARAYADADLFVFPSTTDTLGQTVLEACASGLAVVVTDQGGPASIITHGREGMVLPLRGPQDEPAWASAIVMLLRDTDQRRVMGGRAHTLAQNHAFGASFEDFMRHHSREVL